MGKYTTVNELDKALVQSQMGVIFMVKNRLLSCKIANGPFHVAHIVG